MMASLPLVMDLFGLLFSDLWMVRWQKQWLIQKRASRPGQQGGAAPPDSRQKKKKKKPAQGRFYQRLFSLRVTLWYLIFQRLNFDHTLAAVVANLRAGGADRLGRRGRKLSRQMRSTKTSGYNEARQRVPLECIQDALAHLRKGLLALVGLEPAPRERPGPQERTRQILDGSTLAMLVTARLAAAYPPTCNQSGPSDWSLMRILVGFCARSGAVLSSMEGSMRESEQKMAWSLMAAAAAFTVWIGDRNFGVWSVAAQAARCRQDVLVRLTRARASKLAGGQLMQNQEDRLIQWSPSRHGDQTPPGTERSPVSGRLIYLRFQKAGKWIDLWLFTTLLDCKLYPKELLLDWYGQRWQAELNFRSLKTHLHMAELDVCTPEMARKEFYTGLLAYSLVRAVMWKAGERLQAGVKAISFSQARRVLLDRLQDWSRGVLSLGAWSLGLLEEAAKQTLPKRRRERPSEIRRVRHRRLKFPALIGSRAAARALALIPKSL